MKCENFKNNIVSYLEATISSVNKRLFDEHLKECPECKVLFKEFSETWNAISEPVHETLSPYFQIKLLNRISEYEKAPLLSRIFVFRKVYKPALAALVCALGIFIGYKLGSIPENNQNLASQSEFSEAVYPETYFSLFNEIPEGTFADLYFTVINDQQ